MRIHSASAACGIAAVALTLTLPTMSFATPPAGPDADPQGACVPMGPHGPRAFSHPFGPGDGPGHFRGMGMGPEWGAPPPFLAGLSLTDDQQDKVFSILHAAAPAMHDQAKALRQAHAALRELNTAAQYDESRARALAETAARADSQLMLLRMRTEHDIYALLTPEQRKELEEHRHGRGRPGPRP